MTPGASARSATNGGLQRSERIRAQAARDCAPQVLVNELEDK
jgi:hypothetical protein